VGHHPKNKVHLPFPGRQKYDREGAKARSKTRRRTAKGTQIPGTPASSEPSIKKQIAFLLRVFLHRYPRVSCFPDKILRGRFAARERWIFEALAQAAARKRRTGEN
jgi:hypothetical protein